LTLTLASLAQIVLVDVVLSGDNALVIAMVARHLPPPQRRAAMLWGGLVAIALRLALTMAVAYVLTVPGVPFLGAILLLGIACKLVQEEVDTERAGATAPTSLGPAVARIAMGDYHGSVTILDTASRDELTWPTHAPRINALAIAPDGKTLATASLDRSVKLRDPATVRELHSFSRRGEEPWSVAFAPDGQTLAAGFKDGNVVVWDLASGKERSVLSGHTLGVSALAFAPDGRTLASASWDKTVKLRDATTAQPLATLEGHERAVQALAFSPDGQTLASCDGDEDDHPDAPGAVRLWDVPGGRPRATLRSPRGGFRSVAFAPDGRTLAAAGDEGIVTLWDANP
jgi:WD40 repeat protein